MSKAGGFIMRLTPGRREIFDDALMNYDQYAEAVPEFFHSRRAPLICFIVDDGQITHITSARRGVRAGTQQSRLNLSQIKQLSPPIPIANVLRRISRPTMAAVRKRLDNGGQLPPKSFEDFVDVVLALAPETRQLIERYGRARREQIEGLSPRVRSALATQKEAVATALALAGLKRDPLQAWSPRAGSTITSFLDGLPTTRVREDPMVVNDLMTFPGCNFVRSTAYGAAVFEGKHEHLTVILANRQPLESTLGTDLIYFNETYKCFVMVQYKAMEQDAQDKEAVFRLPNIQLTKEIKRMERALVQLRACAPNRVRDGFRLHDNPFFLKFCPRIVFNPDDAGLVPGMYLPLDYWRLMENDPALMGERGGQLLTYRNVGRYLDNTSFATLVGKAWVGTTITQSAVLEDLVRDTLEQGRSVAIGIKRVEIALDLSRGSISDDDPFLA